MIEKDTNFTVPAGLYRLRILAVGGGGAGCGIMRLGQGKSGEPAIRINVVRGPTTIRVDVGRGGGQAKNDTVKRELRGQPTSFGNYVKAKGGNGCDDEGVMKSVEDLEGIDHFNSNITQGKEYKLNREGSNNLI